MNREAKEDLKFLIKKYPKAPEQLKAALKARTLRGMSTRSCIFGVIGDYYEVSHTLQQFRNKLTTELEMFALNFRPDKDWDRYDKYAKQLKEAIHEAQE